MSFQAPIFLLGIAVVPLMLAALALARRRPARYVVRFPALPTLAAVVPRAPRWRRIVPTALLCLALAGLTLALARSPSRSSGRRSCSSPTRRDR